MYMLIVNFNLKGIGAEEYQAHCDKVAPIFRNIPGLISKVWLADRATNTYGEVYTWETLQVMEEYLHSEIFYRLNNNPNFENVTARQFGVLEGPTAVTHGLAHADSLPAVG